MAEEELRNEEMELFMQKCLTATGSSSLRTKYHEDLQRLCDERHAIKQKVNEVNKFCAIFYKKVVPNNFS